VGYENIRTTTGFIPGGCLFVDTKFAYDEIVEKDKAGSEDFGDHIRNRQQVDRDPHNQQIQQQTDYAGQIDAEDLFQYGLFMFLKYQ
jgi:hypothetical protein